jgi:hypothetical protein
MTLLQELHQRIDQLTPEQLGNLKRWLDYREQCELSGKSDDLTQLAQAAAQNLSRILVDDDWSQDYEQWKKSRGTADATG